MRPLLLTALLAFAAHGAARVDAGQVDAGQVDAGLGPLPARDGGGRDAGTEPVVRFIAVGDTGTGTAEQYAVGAAMGAWCHLPQHPCDFVVMLGDNIYNNGVEGPHDLQWVSKFETPYASVNIPFWAVLGNHDYGGTLAFGQGNEKQKGQYEIDYAHLPGQSKWKMPANHYRFSAGHAEFFATDTTEAMYAAAPELLKAGFDDTAQRTDLESWVKASTATWKIALGHHPWVSNGGHGNAGSYDGLAGVDFQDGRGVKALLDQRVCGKVDVYLSGHDHNLQWPKDTCRGTELVISGGGHSAKPLYGKNPSWFEVQGTGFLYVVLSGRTFTGSFVDATGRVLFTRTFTK